MFTGLVTDVGTVRKAEHRNGLTRFEVESGFALEDIAMGASIMHSGVCLTVVDMGQGERGAWFAVEAVPETLAKTVLGDWNEGARVNLEQSLKLGDELIRPPVALAKYFATKGSAAVNGVSLTVADALPNGDFQVAVIPHTWEVTTLSELQPGSRVNLEIDMLARYVARMIGADAPEGQ